MTTAPNRPNRPAAPPDGPTATPPNPLGLDIPVPAVFGPEAAARASLVSGPFTAEPVAYASPVGSDGISELLGWAAGRGVSIVPRAAGTGMPGGNTGPHVVAEIGEGLRDIEILESGRMRVGAGVTGLEADRSARRRGFFLPFLPSSRKWCTFGGMVGTNAAGARTFGYGVVRDWVVGLEGFFADGTPFRLTRGSDSLPAPLEEALTIARGLPLRSDGSLEGWPEVRKNSSGYALDRISPGRRDGEGGAIDLMVGSEGTLAVVTAVEIATAPIPRSVALALIPVSSVEALADVARGAAEIGATACEFLGRRLLSMCGLEDPRFGPTTPYAVVLVELSGPSDDLQERLRDFARPFLVAHRDPVVTSDPDEMDDIWSLRHAASPVIAREADRGRISTQFIEDSVVPPDRLAAYLVGLDDILDRAGVTGVVFGHAGDANVHANPLLDVTRAGWAATTRSIMTDVVALVADLGGTLSGEHGDGRIRTPFLEFVWPAHLTGAFRRIKEILDPVGTLNPGVIVPLAGQDPFEGFHPRPRSYPDVET